MSNDTYFAAKAPEEAASIILSKADSWMNYLQANRFIYKLKRCWAFYHGIYNSDNHEITFGGEQGELTQISINHLRNLAQHMLVMITANRPTMEARAVNTDYKSLVQTTLANGLLDYYMREKKLEIYLKNAVEQAIVLGAGFIKMEWDATAGEEYEFNEETKTPIYEGDVKFTNLSVFDVVMDSNKQSQEHDWITCRTPKNRFDLIAKYPEYADKIKKIPAMAEFNKNNFQSFMKDETDDVFVYEFYHRRTECLPDGRYMLFLDSDVVLMDAPMPYRSLPIYRIAPADYLGTPFGYTPIFDLMPIQEAINSLYSTILTNQSAFGVQNVMIPRGADITSTQLAGGLNVIEYNAQAGKVEPLNLTNTPAEIFKFLEMLEKAAETISGVNSVARGNPEASLKSGNALALVQSMALQFMSGLQQSYVLLIEGVGTGLVNMLKDFAAAPRVAAIAGRNNRTEMKEFKGDDLNAINRVVVTVGNPLSKSTAGRVQMAEQMLQMGIIKTPQQYFSVLNTGNLDVMTENDQHELFLIKSENESMVDGRPVVAIAVDDHQLHINEHKAVLADPELRQDQELLGRVLGHIQEHIQLLKTTNPDLLMLTRQQPLPPDQPQAGPAPQNMPQQGPPPIQAGNKQQSEAAAVLHPPQLAPHAGQPGLPSPAKPPKPFHTAPVDAKDLLPQSN